MGKYSELPEWASVEPIPLNDGSQHFVGDAVMPLATIAYPDDYLEATSYLRAVMAADEVSERALALTEDIIELNPAHYTVWLYRAKILKILNKDPKAELAWLEKISLSHLKSYQIWHHRQLIISNREAFPTVPEGETDFLMTMLRRDSKNYHVWTYRHWLVRHFKLWDSPREMADVAALITSDVRNNSAWNHRFMLNFGPRGEVDSGLPAVNFDDKTGDVRRGLEVVDEDLVDGEVEYAKQKIKLAPENRSPWSYARGALRAAGRSLSELKQFASSFVDKKGDSDDRWDDPRVVVAAEVLVDILIEEIQAEGTEQEVPPSVAGYLPASEKKDLVVSLLTSLKEEYNPIRRNYYDYRIRTL